MKERTDYVSNSSSSSFIVISNAKETNEEDVIKREFSKYTEEYSEYLFPNKKYKFTFGWEFENSCLFGEKLNFIGLQLLYILCMKINGTKSQYCEVNPQTDFDKYYAMVRKVCLERFGIKVKLDTSNLSVNLWEGTSDKFVHSVNMGYEMYIDHQSSVEEGSCMDMFESEDAMYDFLSNSNSYVEGGNDNG